MATEYRPTTLSPGELAFLGGEFAYPPSAGRVEDIGEWKILRRQEDKTSGLEIYAVQKAGTNEVTFAIRGTDAVPGPLTDWVGPNLAFSGSYHIQARQAIEFINKFVKNLRLPRMPGIQEERCVRLWQWQMDRSSGR